MKCALQRAVGLIPFKCDNCCELQEQIISSRTVAQDDGTAIECNAPCQRQGCWFQCSRNRKDAIRSGCAYGECKGLFVWVPQGGKEDFSRLVFDTLRYATRDPAPGAVKEVTMYLDESGAPTQLWLASQVVRSTVPVATENKALAHGADLKVASGKLDAIINHFGNRMNPPNAKATDFKKLSLKSQLVINKLDVQKQMKMLNSSAGSIKSTQKLDFNRQLDLNRRFILLNRR